MTVLTLSVNLFFCIFLIIVFIYIKMSTNLWPNYYQQSKERLRQKACERYQSLSKEKKEKKQQYSPEHYKNLSENEKINWLSIEKIL